ncbi:MAG: YerC/YecD family TrpR-related protein [Gammaproteobacteria bacterium]|jgi:TrpR-related protein YerC/YecD|nr:transcriptional regulator [Cryomorphaceae bacterium]MDA1037382.1 YerC/YecD family TrpR-related protein [Pseudomonadota bacterium]NCX24849.1 transcriptional regulator [Pseudomonadota bacterium]NCX30247.1 transcriptional regulator [Pseudomonadota bacterium]NCX34896.1 transcriptional regulator [Pseudomonadota bacterium]
MKNLNEALLMLKNKNEVDGFLKDLCTPAELKALEERWSVAQLLYEDNLSYREIASKLKTSTTTVTRVARFLSNEPYQGYKKLLERISNEK